MKNQTLLKTPLTEDAVRALQVGEHVAISGLIHTARDAVHKHLASDGALPPGVDLRGGVLYHCGPVVLRDANGLWRVVAAGPTTSAREEPYEAGIVGRWGVRALIGKGGMGGRTLRACQEFGCVYLHAVGGAAQVLAECVTAVEGVWFLDEFGSPEAMWALAVEQFPAIVTMDAHGQSLHQQVYEASRTELEQLLSRNDPGLTAVQEGLGPAPCTKLV